MGSSNSARHAYIVGSKWIYKIKRYVDGSIQRYKASLVAQGYNQKYGWDYDELFASVVRQSTFHNLHIEHMDVKCELLNGNLEETTTGICLCMVLNKLQTCGTKLRMKFLLVIKLFTTTEAVYIALYDTAKEFI